MSGSNWRERTETWIALSLALNFCAVLVAAFLYFLPYPSLGSSGEGSRSGYENYAADCDKSEATYRSFIRHTPRPEIGKQRSDYDAEKSKLAHEFSTACDLAAQHLAAEGSSSAAHSGWYTMGAALFGVLLLIGTLIETMRVTRVTREIGQDQSRAYINVTSARIYEGSPDRVTIHIKNSGVTPSKVFSAVHDVEVVQPLKIEWFENIGGEPTPESHWIGLGAGESTTIHIRPEVGNLTIHQTGAACLRGAIIYTTVYDEVFFTEFAYLLPPNWGFPYEDKVVSSDEVEIFRYVEMVRPSLKKPLRAFHRSGNNRN